jgi:hypothetical protein
MSCLLKPSRRTQLVACDLQSEEGFPGRLLYGAMSCICMAQLLRETSQDPLAAGQRCSFTSESHGGQPRKARNVTSGSRPLTSNSASTLEAAERASLLKRA